MSNAVVWFCILFAAVAVPVQGGYHYMEPVRLQIAGADSSTTVTAIIQGQRFVVVDPAVPWEFSLWKGRCTDSGACVFYNLLGRDVPAVATITAFYPNATEIASAGMSLSIDACVPFSNLNQPCVRQGVNPVPLVTATYILSKFYLVVMLLTLFAGMYVIVHAHYVMNTEAMPVSEEDEAHATAEETRRLFKSHKKDDNDRRTPPSNEKKILIVVGMGFLFFLLVSQAIPNPTAVFYGVVHAVTSSTSPPPAAAINQQITADLATFDAATRQIYEPIIPQAINNGFSSAWAQSAIDAATAKSSAVAASSVADAEMLLSSTNDPLSLDVSNLVATSASIVTNNTLWYSTLNSSVGSALAALLLDTAQLTAFTTDLGATEQRNLQFTCATSNVYGPCQPSGVVCGNGLGGAYCNTPILCQYGTPPMRSNQTATMCDPAFPCQIGWQGAQCNVPIPCAPLLQGSGLVFNDTSLNSCLMSPPQPLPATFPVSSCALSALGDSTLSPTHYSRIPVVFSLYGFSGSLSQTTFTLNLDPSLATWTLGDIFCLVGALDTYHTCYGGGCIGFTTQPVVQMAVAPGNPSYKQVLQWDGSALSGNSTLMETSWWNPGSESASKRFALSAQALGQLCEIELAVNGDCQQGCILQSATNATSCMSPSACIQGQGVSLFFFLFLPLFRGHRWRRETKRECANQGQGMYVYFFLLTTIRTRKRRKKNTMISNPKDIQNKLKKTI